MSKSKKQSYQGVVYSTNPDFNYDSGSDEDSTTLPPKQQNLRVSIDKKQRGGKAVTVVSGFIGNMSDLDVLGKKLKQRCGVGGSVKEGQILIQGTFKERVIQLLEQEGYRVKGAGG